MSNKRNLTTILAIAGATILAAGGSAFVTNAGLSLIDRDTTAGQGTEVASSEKETEQPLTVEKFAATKDSFTVKPQADDKKNTKKDSAGTGESEQNASQDGSTDGSDTAQSSTSSDGSSSGSGASTDFSSSEYYSSDGKFYNESEGGYYDDNGLYHDEWGGYYSADGAYYDGQGGYWDGDGYHKTGSGNSSSGSGSSGSSSSGGNSSGITIDTGNGTGDSSGSSSSTAYDDSYMMYDVDSRYVSADELSGWSSEDLAKLRNEIFARHGRIFTTQKWIDYFATKTWYVPRYDNVDSMLNDYEWANLDVILKLEDQRN